MNTVEHPRNQETGFVMYFVDQYFCQNTKIQPATCDQTAPGDGGTAFVVSTPSNMVTYRQAFQLASEHAPTCQDCQLKMIPLVRSTIRNK